MEKITEFIKTLAFSSDNDGYGCGFSSINGFGSGTNSGGNETKAGHGGGFDTGALGNGYGSGRGSNGYLSYNGSGRSGNFPKQ